MKFWRNNRLDGEFDMPIPEVVDLFMASPQATAEGVLDRQLRLFLTNPDGPISAVWDEGPAYNTLFTEVLLRIRAQATPSTTT